MPCPLCLFPCPLSLVPCALSLVPCPFSLVPFPLFLVPFPFSLFPFPLLVPRRLPFPRRSDDATVEPLLHEVSSERLSVTVRREHACGACFLDRGEKRRPVGMIREHEAAVVSALTTNAPDAHEAGCERVGDIAQPAHPWSPTR